MKYIFIVAGFFYIHTHAMEVPAAHQTSKNSHHSNFMDVNNKPSLGLINLLNLTGAISIPLINDLTQKSWLRNPEKERWELTDEGIINKSEIMHTIKQMGFSNSKKPYEKHYNYVFIHEHDLKSLKRRFAFLLKIWKEGIRFKHLIFLTTDTPVASYVNEKNILDQYEQKTLKIEFVSDSFSMPTTRNELAQLLYNKLKFDVDFKKIPVTFTANKKPVTQKYANTVITLQRAFIGKTPGKCLAISEAPYIKRQHMVMQQLCPSGFTLETVGPEADPKLPVSVYLDEIARLIYQTVENDQE